MTEREQDCRRLAELLGLEFTVLPPPDRLAYFHHGVQRPSRSDAWPAVPHPTFSSRHHYVFAYDLSLVLGPRVLGIQLGSVHFEPPVMTVVLVSWRGLHKGQAADLSHAAVRAGIAALEAHRV